MTDRDAADREPVRKLRFRRQRGADLVAAGMKGVAQRLVDRRIERRPAPRRPGLGCGRHPRASPCPRGDVSRSRHGSAMPRRTVGPLGALGVDEGPEAPQREEIALRAEAGDHAVGAQRHVGVVPEALALVHVRDVHLEDRALEGVERVEDGDRGVGEGARVDDDAAGALPRLVDPVDDLVFAVALVEAEAELQLRRQRAAGGLDVGESLVPVDMRLALAQKIEVRTVEDGRLDGCMGILCRRGSPHRRARPRFRQTAGTVNFRTRGVAPPGPIRPLATAARMWEHLPPAVRAGDKQDAPGGMNVRE